jgi:putative hydrolase of the HAD superfamily
MAVIFDLDDTLMDYSGAVYECWRIICDRFAPELCDRLPDDITGAIKIQSKWYWADAHRHREGRLDMNRARMDIIGAVFQQFGIENADLIREMAFAYDKEREKMYRLYPETIDVLKNLISMNIALAMITNGDAGIQRKKIDRFGLEPYFQIILIESEFGAGKPDERVYRHVAEMLNLRPSDIWMVGDNLDWDVLGPQKIGIAGIWHNRSGAELPEPVPARPAYIIKDLSEILGLIRGDITPV